MLTRRERDRYSRQIMLDGCGERGQEKLKGAKVFIAGVGGLGSCISIYLATAGVGTMRIVDKDVVQLSNLNRQIVHWEKDISRRKVESGGEKLQQINSDIKIEIIAEMISNDNVRTLVGDSQLIVDATDNFPTRYILNRAALSKNIPFSFGGVHGFDGMVSTIIPGETACLRCMFPESLSTGDFPVLGVTPGIVGCIQALEVLKCILGAGELLKNRILVWDGLNTKLREVGVRRDPLCQDCSSS